MEAPDIICKNCSTEYTGKHCPQCGQRAKVKRITTKAVFEEIRDRLIHLDSGFFFTFFQLVRRPGSAIREFLEGKRVLYTKPIKFLIWATALNFLVFHLIGLDKEMMDAVAQQQTGGQSAGAKEFQAKFMQYIFDHPAIMIFLLIPNLALFSWLYFRKAGYNYAEHFVLNSYLMGAVSLFGLVLNPLSRLAGTDKNVFVAKTALSMLVWVVYVAWAYGGFFRPQRRKWLCWLKAALAVISGYAMMIIAISVLTVIFILLFWQWVKPYFT
ncbi:MAG: DUF3667 domain-containing protein [Saprospiraceae bacterium]